jgi:hypothetical protein
MVFIVPFQLSPGESSVLNNRNFHLDSLLWKMDTISSSLLIPIKMTTVAVDWLLKPRQ